ncbi:MAG: class I SAM-dependent methyltransferase [Chloroflexota bacterium]
MVTAVQDQLITDRAAFKANFRLPPDLEARYAIQGQRAFAQTFIAARDKVENVYYALADEQTTPAARTRKFLGAMLDPILGKPMSDAEQFYQTFGRLMRSAWLSISVGLYDEEIQHIEDVAQRLIIAQVNTVDINWRPAVSHIANTSKGGLIVEVGTGRGNSIARLATLLPDTRIVSVTISPEQREIVQGIVTEMGLSNVEIRLGDIFDPSVTEDLVGQADAVGAIEVILHFPTNRKVEGMRMMTRLLKPTAPLCIIDSAIDKPLSAFSEKYYANQSIYFGQREQYMEVFKAAQLTPTCYVDYTPEMNQAFKETTQILRRFRPQLAKEFGSLMSWLWPEVPGTVYVSTLKNIRYVHVVGVKN